jgi:hypothetical protein
MEIHCSLGIFAVGTFIAFYGALMMRGVMVYQTGRRITNYSPATVATDIFIALLAFMPPATLVKSLSDTKEAGT